MFLTTKIIFGLLIFSTILRGYSRDRNQHRRLKILNAVWLLSIFIFTFAHLNELGVVLRDPVGSVAFYSKGHAGLMGIAFWLAGMSGMVAGVVVFLLSVGVANRSKAAARWLASVFPFYGMFQAILLISPPQNRSLASDGPSTFAVFATIATLFTWVYFARRFYTSTSVVAFLDVKECPLH